jgi:hypothetical protein
MYHQAVFINQQTFRRQVRLSTEEKQMKSLEEHPIFSLFLCVKCHHPRITQGRFDHQKAHQLKHTCAPCGDIEASHQLKMKRSRVIPINKSTPTYIHSMDMLSQLNPKRTT